MTSEIELFGKDSVKLNILKELVSGDINISMSLNGGVYQDYLSQIHREGSRMQVLGKFNLSEDPNGDVLTIRPIMVSGLLKVTFGFSGQPFSGEKKVSVFRSATKTIERKYDVNDMLTSVEFIPQGNVKYMLRLTYGDAESEALPDEPERPAVAAPDLTESPDDFDVLTSPVAEEPPKPEPPASPAPPAPADPEPATPEEDVTAAEERLEKLRERRKSAKELLTKLEAEYEKDYDEYQRELEEYRQQYNVDQSVIEFYRDNDIQPIEDIMKELSEKLTQAEQQIRLIILGRQKKTMEIETQVKSNKR
ncbi:MAG: hypothetical protein IIY89_01680 [Clostridia bacterium]|nr:hypothetical protein [Clostridia bacterium]